MNRPLGRRLAAVAFISRLTPNQITGLSFAASMSGVAMVMFLEPTWPVSICAALALLLGYALDSADGQLARLLELGGAAGEFLDHVVDAVRQPLVHLGIAGSLYLRDDVNGRWPVVVALAFSVVTSAWFFSQTLWGKLVPQRPAAAGAADPGWMSFVKAPYDVGSLYLIVLALPVAGLFVVLYTALGAFTLAAALLSVRRKYAGLASVGDVT